MWRSFTTQRYPFIIVLITLTVPFFSYAASSTSAASSQSTSTSPATTSPSITPLPPVDTSKVVLSPLAQTRITNLAANVSNRLDASLRRLTNVHDRINSRIDKLTLAGNNPEAARTELLIARGHLDTAKANLATIDREVAAFIGSSNPRTGFIRLKATYTTIYTELTLAHSSLRLALSNLDGTIITPVATDAATSTTL